MVGNWNKTNKRLAASPQGLRKIALFDYRSLVRNEHPEASYDEYTDAVKRHKDAQGTRCSLGKAAHLGCAQLCVHAHARHARACV